MIRAIEVGKWQDNLLHRSMKFIFELTTNDGQRLLYARTTREGGNTWDGWYTEADLYEPGNKELADRPLKDGLEIVMVDLPREVAACLAEAILLETTGIPTTDARAIRRDLDHERSRRDNLEDVIIRIAGSRVT